MGLEVLVPHTCTPVVLSALRLQSLVSILQHLLYSSWTRLERRRTRVLRFTMLASQVQALLGDRSYGATVHRLGRSVLLSQTHQAKAAGFRDIRRGFSCRALEKQSSSKSSSPKLSLFGVEQQLSGPQKVLEGLPAAARYVSSAVIVAGALAAGYFLEAGTLKAVTISLRLREVLSPLVPLAVSPLLPSMLLPHRWPLCSSGILLSIARIPPASAPPKSTKLPSGYALYLLHRVFHVVLGIFGLLV